MPIPDPSLKRRATQKRIAAVPAHPQFKMRLLTLAVLSACSSLAIAAPNHAAAPANPLPTGGVVSDPATASIVNSAPNLMQINQTAAKTTIHWNSFDIGQGYTVRFNQPSASAEAMNYIGGANPSVIQGTLSANGKVYLVNSNGILFDGTAQVNVNTLIASSLDISQTTFDNGITSNLVGKTDPTLVATMVLNTAGQVINYGTIKSVKVDGATGQVATDPATGKPVEEGGAIMLFAPQVENHGVITANNGQVILAAGKSVYLQLYNDTTSATYNKNDLSMRGFLVKVTAAPDGSLNLSQLIAAQKLNSAANIGGEIHSDRGNTTLTGLVVNQSGLVSANTATTVNGSIWLKAENYDAASKQTTYGTLTTSKNSVTQVMPEDDGTTLTEGDAYTDNSLYDNGAFPHYQGTIKMLGQTIDHEGSAIAPGGRIVVGKEYVVDPVTGSASKPDDSGRVYLGKDSVLSTAGLWVDLPYEATYLSFKLGSLDLADAPLQKGGFLVNQWVTVDTRKPSPLLFSISKQINSRQRSVREKATTGGTITVNTGDVIEAGGATLDVSGGGYRYAGGMATTTYLRSRGRLYDIATAPTNLQYDGIVTRSAKVQGFVEGKSAGLLAIDARHIALGGNVFGGVTVGPYQRAADVMPGLGRLVLGTQSILAGANLDLGTMQDGTTANNLDNAGAVYALKDVTFGSGPAVRAAIAAAIDGMAADPLDAALPAALQDTVLLSTDLFGGAAAGNLSTRYQGFGSLAVRASGTIDVPQGVGLDLGPQGALFWLAPQIDVAGTVRAQGGSLVFNQNADHSPFGNTHLAATAIVSAAGGWVNDAYAGGPVSVPDVIDGGSVVLGGSNLLSGGATLDKDSRIDVSGGALLDASGKLHYGSGGAIALPTVSLDGVSLLAYSGGEGGTLTLGAPVIDVGGGASTALSPGFFAQGGFTQYILDGGTQVNFNADLHPLAYRRLATATAALRPTGTSFGDISMVTTGQPDYLRAAASLKASTGASSSGTYALGANETGITVAPAVHIATDPLGTIDLASKTRMDIEGALVAPGGTIRLSLDPGGDRFFYDTASSRFNALRIGDMASLSTAGVFLPDLGQPGLISGQVLAGGTIDITANKNDLAIGSGATLDVSGTSHVVDLPLGRGAGYLHANVASEGGRIAIKATENAYLDGTFRGRGGDASVAGGSFELDLSYHGQYTDTTLYNTLLADTSGDANAIAALAFMDPGLQQLRHTIVVRQSTSPLAQDGSSQDASVIHNLVDAQGRYVAALRANVSADQLVNGVTQGGVRVGGGFDRVVLSSDNRIQFGSDVTNFAPRDLLRLDTPEILVQSGGKPSVGIGALDGQTWLSAQAELINTPNAFRLSTNLPESVIDQHPWLYSVDLATGVKRPVSALHAQVPVATTGGSAGLSVNAGQIALAGNVTVNGVGDLALNSTGDLRFEGFPVAYVAQNSASDPAPLIASLQALSGHLSSAGNITLQAGQIYPATAVDYTVAAESVSTDSISQDPVNGVLTAAVTRSSVANGLISVKGSGATDLPPVLSAGGQLTLQADRIDQGGTLRAPLGTLNLEGGQSLTLESGSLTSVSAIWGHDGVQTEMVVPYGATQSVGQSMWYGSLPTTAAPAKQINAHADSVTVAPGATLDLRGGGDIAAMEWIPGIGGSKDVLAAPGTYAIVPGAVFRSADSTLDTLSPVAVNGNTPYDMVHLGAGSGLPEGDYALLPAYYALLPGAYLVKAQHGAASLAPGYAAAQPDGSVVVAGRLGYAGTGIRQSTWSGFSIQSGADALSGPHAQAEYRVTGSAFFAEQAVRNNSATPALPQDGGRLSIGAAASLAFAGNLLAQAAVDKATGASGAIGQVDLYGSKFAIVGDAVAAPAGYTRLRADDLSRLDASLLVGGKRTDTADGQSLDVKASDVIVDLDGGTLVLPELWLAATDTLSVSGTSTLATSGKVIGRAGTLTVNTNPDGKQYGAVLGLSGTSLAPIARTGTLDTDPSHGNLDIGTGAKLIAKGGAVVVDSTGTPQMGGVVEGDTLAIGARRIALGAVPQGSDALVLDSVQLAALGHARNFVLRSYSSIDLYGDVNLGQVGSGSFTFDSAGLVGHDVGGTGAPSNLSANLITLQNLSGTALAANTPGTGTLTLNADKLVLSDSSKNGAGFTVAGFNQVDLNAGEVSLQGSGTLTVASDLNIASARIAAGGQQADQQIRAYDVDQDVWHVVKVTQPASTPAFADAAAPGGKLQMAGRAVDFGGNTELQSGRLTLAAHGTAAGDGVTLENGSRIDLSAYEKTFAQGVANLTESVSAGRLALSSDNGSVDAQAGSIINLQGGAAGGDAGVLRVAATNGTVALEGSLQATAASGQQSGSADIDAANLANFSALNTALETGGFGQGRTMRARAGNIDVAVTDSVTAKNVQLVADAGSVDVQGTIDASGAAGGGTVELDAGQGVHLSGGSRIRANGTSSDTAADAAYSDGGRVALYARNGMLAFDRGGLIDVSAAAAGKSSGGEVVFSAPRTANGSGLQVQLNGQVKVAGGTASVSGGRAPEAGSVVLEGFRRYTGISATSAASSTSSVVYVDYDTFMNAADGMHDTALTTLQAGGSDVGGGNLKVRAGVELVSSADMTVDSAWDLTNPAWLRTGTNQAAGRLALRAAGDLAVTSRLGLPNDRALPPYSGWDLQLAAGSDTASADPLAVRASDTKGDVTLASGATITTSTGDIRIAAGRDVVTDAATAIYTTGRAVAMPSFMALKPLVWAAPASGVNLTDGGGVRITARRNVSGSNNYAAVNDWLRRTSVATTAAVPGATSGGFAYLPAYWWVDRDGNSKAGTSGIQGIATLGGGAIAIEAGQTVQGLSVASATSRSAAATATPISVNNNTVPSEQAVYGGGDVRIDAGGDVLGGQYLVGRGTASLTAGGQIGGLGGIADSGTAPAFWLMGWSDDPALAGAKVQVEALGGVTLGTVANPTVVAVNGRADGTRSTATAGYRGSSGSFFSYTPQDSMAATSVGGDTVIVGAEPNTPLAAAHEVLPPRFKAVAMAGSISSSAQHYFDASAGEEGVTGSNASVSLYQYPDRNGQFQLLAGDSVHDLVLKASDFLPSSLTTPAAQVLVQSDYPGSRGYIFNSPIAAQDARMVTPATLGGYRYAVVADAGDVSDAAFSFPQQSVVAAGNDIANVQLDLQNLGANDVSQVAAGRDLTFTNLLDNGTQWGTMPHIQVAGPGSLLVGAGRDINLAAVSNKPVQGSADLDNVTRIDAVGNTTNLSLPTADAASLTLVSGIDAGTLGKAQADSLFTVLRSVGQFQGLLGQVQGNSMTPESAIADANAVIQTANAAIGTLFAGQVQPGSAPVYETPIDPNAANGRTAVGLMTDAYNGALAAANNAIKALFQDGRTHQGDITLYNARISSATNPGGTGGTINLLAPHGAINVGLPTASSGRNIGIYTAAGGAINAYLSGDMSVNLSKVATFQGGDILLYTSGDRSILDAGRGSRSARTSSPPRLVAELKADGTPTGKLLLLPPLDISGSGIRTVSYDPDGFGPLKQPDPGKVYLLAPTGTIDAGEAGVSSASGLVVAALVVKNADNFSAGGASVGVPSVAGAPPAAPVSSDAAASASKAMDDVNQAGNALAKNDADMKAFRPAFITVEVLGFGGDPVKCGKDDASCDKRKTGGI